MKINMLTVAIPNYNNEKTIKETLASLDGQKDKNHKILFSDNQSSDISALIFKDWALKNSNCKYIKTPQHLTYADHLDFIINNVETSHLVFLAGDEKKKKNYTNLSNKIISHCSELQAVFFRAQNFGDGILQVKRKRFEKRNSRIIRYRSLNAPLGNISGNIFQKKFLKDLFKNKSLIQLAHNCVDHLLCMEATKLGLYLTTNYVGVNYRIWDGFWGPTKTRNRSKNHFIFMLKSIKFNFRFVENLILLRRAILSFFAFIKNS